MRIARSLSWMSLLAGVVTYYATKAAMRRREERQRTEVDESTRWESEGGAPAARPQPPGAPF